MGFRQDFHMALDIFSKTGIKGFDEIVVKRAIYFPSRFLHSDFVCQWMQKAIRVTVGAGSASHYSCACQCSDF
jgi:hypothetical protein